MEFRTHALRDCYVQYTIVVPENVNWYNFVHFYFVGNLVIVLIPNLTYY